MGKAHEWLGADGCLAVAMQILAGVDTRKSRGRKVWAHCPFHLERTPGGAFYYDADEDVGRCHSCGEYGDIIHVWNRLAGRSGDDDDGFREFKERFAPDAPDAASGEHSRREPVGPRNPARRPGWTPRNVQACPELWSRKAGEFVVACEARLARTPAMLGQLAAWGIAEDTARACRLGWNPEDAYRPVTSWGLPFGRNAKGRERRLWLPRGLVIPYGLDGCVVKLKIRRPDPDKGPEALRDLRYYAVPGGMPVLSVYGNPAWRYWVVLETERDGVLVWQAGRDLRIGAVATGSASARPDARTHAILDRARCIVVGLDSDAAGAKNAWEFWTREYPQSVRRPVPPRLGKDQGDLASSGGDVREWLLAALPPHARREVERAAGRRREYASGGRGESFPPDPPHSVAEPAAEAAASSATATGGQENTGHQAPSRPVPPAGSKHGVQGAWLPGGVRPGEGQRPSPVRAEPGEAVRELRALLSRCRQVYAAANHEEGLGARGCDGCRKYPACTLWASIGALVCNDGEVIEFIESQPQGRLRT